MRTVARDGIMVLKEQDRATIKGLERHASGACIHLGKISPGCRICFTGENGGGVQIGQKCNRKCTTCYYSRDRHKHDDTQGMVDNMYGDFFRESLNPNYKPYAVAYQSAGETLYYVDKMLPIAAILKNMSQKKDINIYHHLYSNGELLNERNLEIIKKLGVHEYRFHVSPSGWSDKVFRNMEIVRDAGITLTVEEPSHPIERENILKHLKTFEELGVKHVDMVEIQITADNIDELHAELPDGRMFKDHFYHVYDEGLVYEVMRQVEENNYSFSVLDCNSYVECHRHAKNMQLGLDMDTIDGMCTPFDYGDGHNKD